MSKATSLQYRNRSINDKVFVHVHLTIIKTIAIDSLTKNKPRKRNDDNEEDPCQKKKNRRRNKKFFQVELFQMFISE
jgi:hypothetical protein